MWLNKGSLFDAIKLGNTRKFVLSTQATDVLPVAVAGQLTLVRKLSFGATDETTVKPAASPDTMPGEIFQLENIVEEPLGKERGGLGLATDGKRYGKVLIIH